MKLAHLIAALVALFVSSASMSHAATINQTYLGGFPATISGTLPNQGTALEEAFTLTSPSNLTATTTSYVSGGFETNLLLFNSMGNFITAGAPFGSPDPGTGIVGDTRLVANNLPAGMYTLALTDFLLNQSLSATNLSDGFSQNYGTGSNFVDANGNTRTGAYSIAISTSAPTAVPEPSSLFMAGALLSVLAVAGRKRLK